MVKNRDKTATKSLDYSLLDKIIRRAIYYSTQMIHLANNRDDAQKGDPKVGGHPAACSSSAHILGALHLAVKGPFDLMAVKPHASPMDHSYGHMLGTFRQRDGSAYTEEASKKIMHRLRTFYNPLDLASEPAFQSYHAAWDPDGYGFFPSGTVGIPPVVSTFTSLAYRFAHDHGFEAPKDVHFWSLMGDSEFREGSLAECMPDTAERELGSVTWIVDYNRQNLDGTRIKNAEDMHGTDADRIERLARANGWEVINLKHGKKRLALFEKGGGSELRSIIENLSDFDIQTLILKNDGKVFRERLIELNPKLKTALSKIADDELKACLNDLGGHDIQMLCEAFESCKKSKMPTLVIAHTIKGWGIEGLKAKTGNHSMLPDQSEVDALREQEKIPENDLFKLFESGTKEFEYCKARGQILRNGYDELRALREKNLKQVANDVEKAGGFPVQFGINLKLSPFANTQWMWGQLAARLIRIANTEKTVEDEAKWFIAARHVVTMAPDVGTSTNLNPSMDGKIYAPDIPEDFENKYHVKDKRRPDLVPLEKQDHRHLRFEIEEGNAMSCVGAFGKMKDHIGVPLLPLMTVYDFFIKRALDQYFYNLYWQSGFILVGTPSGVTLSPEGAQHSWKSDFQIPNGITWEPAFAVEMDWIFADAVRRHFTQDNLGRTGVLIRAVTRGIEQKLLMDNLKKQVRFQELAEEQVLEETRLDVLEGGYWLLNYAGYEGYAPGDNVVHLCVMGALVPEVVEASEKLLAQGIFANILVITSPDLIAGTLSLENDYSHLKNKLGVNANLYLTRTQSVPVGRVQLTDNKLELASKADLYSLRGSRIPIVAICDGEPGLLDNIGSVIGVPQHTLAVRKHSKSGTPKDVYKYHHLDSDSIVEATFKILEQAASEEILVPFNLVEALSHETGAPTEYAQSAAEEDEERTRH